MFAEASAEVIGVSSDSVDKHAGFADRHGQLPFNLWGSEMRFGVSCGQLGSDVVPVGESAEDLFPWIRCSAKLTD